MRRLLVVLFLLWGLAPASAQLTQADVQTTINTDVLSCGDQCITAQVLRYVLSQMNTATFQFTQYPNTFAALQTFRGGLSCVAGGVSTPCFVSSQLPTGNAGNNNFALNEYSTLLDNAQTTGQGILLEFGYNFGAASMTGNRTGIYGAVNQQATTGNTVSSGINGNYVAIEGIAFGQANDNGTSASCNSGTAATCRGSLFGQNLVAELHAGANYWANITGLEINVNVYATASVWGKVGLVVSSSSTDVNSGLGYDAAIGLYNQGSSGSTWNYGIRIDDLAGNTAVAHFPISSTGTVFYAGAATSPVANGIDVSGLSSVSGCSFKGRGGFCVNGSGVIGMTPTTWADNQACVAGQIMVDSGFVYVCTATNTVKRAALSTF
jgi:hypothetical protein